MKPAIWNVAAAAAALVACACSVLAQGAPMGASGPLEVAVVELSLQDVPRVTTLPGRAVA